MTLKHDSETCAHHGRSRGKIVVVGMRLGSKVIVALLLRDIHVLQSFNATNCAQPNMMKIVSRLVSTQASQTHTGVDLGLESGDSLESHVVIRF